MHVGLYAVLVVCVAHVVTAEMFTALVDLQRALYAERDVASDLRQYIRREEERLEKLKRTANDLEDHSQEALANVDSYVGNPVNAYLMVKRFTVDWDKNVNSLLQNDSLTNVIKNIEFRREYLPTYEDLDGAAAALLRLQDTYKLDTAELASGNVAGTMTSELSAEDCFHLGRHSYEADDYYHTHLWMNEALIRLSSKTTSSYLVDKKSEILDYLSFVTFKIGRFSYSKEDFYHCVMWMQEALDREGHEVNKTVDRSEILDYLAYATTMQGNIHHALLLTEELLILQPNHERARNNKKYYEKMLKESNTLNGDPADSVRISNEQKLDDYKTSDEFSTYEALCRGETNVVRKDPHKLKCRYFNNNNHPNLVIQPVKMEDVIKKPWLVLFHNVVSDYEIAKIKEIATPRLNRATVQNSRTGQLETATYRISKSAWLRTEEHSVIQSVNNRIQALTGLDMDTAEELQVANYGIGGHYEPHYDFARKHDIDAFDINVGNRIATFLIYKEETHAFKSLGTGNRIATFLIYMSDIDAGGATVFPYIGVRLLPKKGTAAFWYNLYKNGEGIYDTRHAACPVLVGSKWVSNKWIHERGQEFRRPCGLKEEI